MNILKTLGSLTFAIVLISSLTLILIVSTTLESLYGTPFVQRFFYQSGWFDVFLALVFLNILCSTLTRWPFKKYHTGFVITHIGILLLLIGSLLTLLLSVDGQMALGESEQLDQIVLSQYRLAVHRHEGEKGWTGGMDLDSSNPRGGKLTIPGTPFEFSVDETWEDAYASTEIVQGAKNDTPNPAIRFTLSSERVGLNDTLWLVVNDPLDSNSAETSLGPATVLLKTKKPAAASSASVQNTSTPRVIIARTEPASEFEFALDPLPKQPFPLGNSGLTVSDVQFFPDARVDNNRLVSLSDKLNNPAVEFTVTDAAGQSERHTKFARFPDFDSLHGKKSQSHFGLNVSMESPEPAETPARGLGATLAFYAVNGQWSFISKGSTGGNSGAIEAGKSYSAGWMDFQFRIDELLDRAIVKRRMHHAKTGEKGQIAARVSLKNKGKLLFTDWVTADQPFRFGSDQGPIVAVLEKKHLPVPFTLQLNDFRKVDYPGTTNAQSYESDVTLTDPTEHLTISKTISMNKPLDYKGYRIFQSSYSQDDSGEISIFTVAKNPGIGLIYVGAIIMFLGVVIIFYIKPLSSFSQVNGKGVKK